MNKLKVALAAAAFGLVPFASPAAVFTDCSAFTAFSDGDGFVSGLNPGQFDCAFAIQGSDTGSGNFATTTYLATATSAMIIDFLWTYATQDIDGPAFDVFGYMINGIKTQLSDDGGLPVQIGSSSFSVAAGDVFGWYLDANDDQLGAAVSANLVDFAAVPLPAGGLLLVGALGGLAALRRRAKKA